MRAIIVVDNIPNFVNSITKGVLKPKGNVGKLEIVYISDDGEFEKSYLINTYGVVLKPIPEKEIVRGFDRYEEGWNDCIDEILGVKYENIKS